MVLAGFQSDEWRVKKYSARLGFGSSGQKMTFETCWRPIFVQYVERVYLWQIFLYRIHRDWVILPPFDNSNVISLESNRVVLFGKISC